MSDGWAGNPTMKKGDKFTITGVFMPNPGPIHAGDIVTFPELSESIRYVAEDNAAGGLTLKPLREDEA